MSNRSDGVRFERRFVQILASAGFWVHRMAQTSAGQPFDVIAVRNGYAYAVDCKACANDRFAFSRIENNQWNAFYLWEDRGNGDGWIALEFSDKSVWMLPSQFCSTVMEKHKSMTKEEVERYGIYIEDWCKKCR